MSEAIQLTNVRLSFPSLIEANSNKDYPNAPPKYQASFIMPPNHPDYPKFMAEVGRIATEKWKEQAGQILQIIQGDRRLRCYGNGSEKVNKTTLKVHDGYEGMVWVSAASNQDRPPVMVELSGKPVDNANTMARQVLARKLYGGCYVNVALRPWIQDNQYGRAVRCEIIAVQFCKDGPAFGDAPPDVSSMFGAVQVPANDGLPFAQPKMPWEV